MIDMKIINYLLTMIVLVTAGAYRTGAQEIVTDNNIVPGARALGMGGAQIAGANDITAAFSNPAALARINEFNFNLGLARFERKIESNLASSGFNAKGVADDDNFTLGSIGIAYPVPTIQGSLVFGLAYNRVKNFNGSFYQSGFNESAFVLDNDIWGGFQTEEIIEDGGMGVVTFAGAVDVSPNISLGLE
jgi:long-subunit fatty acid transport protein